MKRIVVVAVLSLLTACASPLPQTPPGGVAAEVAAPELKAGSVWRYAVSDGFTRLPRETVEYRVRSVADDTVTVDVLSPNRQTTELYARDGNWLRRPATNMQEFTYRPVYRAFDFPLTAGKKWEARASAIDTADGRNFPVTVWGHVLGWEKVKVPAGEFDTLKVQRTVFLDFFRQGDRGQSVIQETDWYAPALGQAVRREAVSKYLKLAALPQSSRFLRVRDSDRSDGGGVPRYEQDEWLVYELVGHTAGR